MHISGKKMTDQDNIATVLAIEGLDVQYWQPKFEQNGLHSKGALKHVQGDIDLYLKLERLVRYDWEKKALRHILKVEDQKETIERDQVKEDQDIGSLLKAEGLTMEDWLPRFKSNGLTTQGAIQHAQGDIAVYSRLEKLAKFEWEKKALQKILHVKSRAERKRDRRKEFEQKHKIRQQEAQRKEKEEEKIEMEKQKKEKLELEKQAEKAQSVLQELEKARIEGKNRHDERVKELEESIRSTINNISPDTWTASDGSLDKLIGDLRAHHEMLNGALQPREKWSDAQVVEKASGGRALRGILLTKDLDDQLTERPSLLLKAPENVSLGGASLSIYNEKQFSMKHQEDTYKKMVDILGVSVGVSATIPVYGSLAISAGVSTSTRDENEETHEEHTEMQYYSTIRHSSEQLASYTFNNEDMILSENALQTLQHLKTLIRFDRSKVQAQCVQFFKDYGSHANKGPLHFGGNFWWTCSTDGFMKKDVTEVKKLQSRAVSANVGVTFMGIGASTEVSIEKIKGEYSGSASQTSIASTTLEVNKEGGPNEVSDPTSWRVGLVSSNSTWILTDRGNRFIAVWDVIRMNHSDELHETVDVLREAWEEMTGLTAERDLQLASYNPENVLKQVIEWNESDEFAPEIIEENLEYLIKVKRDLIQCTGNPYAWVEVYVSHFAVQEFIESTVDLMQEDKSSHGRSIFLMKQVLEPRDLKMVTYRKFPDKNQFIKFLYRSKTPSVDIEMQDFEAFNSYLIKIIEELEIAIVDDVLSFERSAGDSHENYVIAASNVAKAIHSLRSQPQFKESYDDVFLKTLIFPFKTDEFSNPITLIPLSLEDVKYLQRMLDVQRKVFLQYSKETNPLQVQACLFYVAVSTYFKETEVWKDESQLKKCLLQIEQNLLSLKTQVEPSITKLLNEFISDNCHLFQFMKDMEDMMRTGLPLYPATSKGCTAKGHSLYHALESRVHQAAKDIDHTSVLQMNDKAHRLFRELNLCQYYPKRLTMQDALRIRSDTLKMSLNKEQISHLSQLSALTLHKLMSYDYLCRSDLMEKCQDRSMKVHPMDNLLALIVCSDEFLKQDLMSRLAECQLAIPFIIPDPFTQQLTLSLWGMRSIVKKWKSYVQNGDPVEYEYPIISYQTPIVSFIRIGKRQRRGCSKSKILSEVLNKTGSHHDYFFHRNCSGGHFPLLIGEGLIDACWYLPAGRIDDEFPIAITFLNLHGDACHYPEQSRFLGHISSMFFILLTETVDLTDETLAILKNLGSDAVPGGVVLLNDTEDQPTNLQTQLSNSEVIDLLSINEHETKMKIQSKIKEKLPLSTVHHFKSLEQCTDHILKLKSCKIYVDEHSSNFRKGKSHADSILNLISSYKPKRNVDGEKLTVKEYMLPLQGKYQEWASWDKECHRQFNRGKKPVREYTDEIERKMKEIRSEQLQHVYQLTVMMESFVLSLLSLEGKSNSTVRNFFLHCLRSGLNDVSRQNISHLRQKYEAEKSALLKAEDQRLTSEVTCAITRHKKELCNIREKISKASFGLEHLLREVGQLYETAASDQSSDSVKPEHLSRLPKAAAELLIDGYPLEVMDGDAAHVPVKWVRAIIHEVMNLLPMDDPQIYVLSVLGIQSSGKSTMLNTAFGLKFSVSGGRCTRGAFMQLVPVSDEMKERINCNYVLVIDTEGLRAPDLDWQQTQKHDNELATFVIGLANVTLITISGEVATTMDDILQTCVHAFLRMNKVKYNPRCQFVYRQTGGGIQLEIEREKFVQKLDNMAVAAAEAEGYVEQYKTFDDVIKFNNQEDIHHIPGLWEGHFPMVAVSRGYSESAQNLKYHLVEYLEEGTRANSFSSFRIKIHDLWEALLTEKFLFSFKNTLEITTYNSIETLYNSCDWKFQQFMLKWERKAANDIMNTNTEDIKTVWREKKQDATDAVDKMHEECKNDMDEFIKESKQKDLLLQWKKNFEVKLEFLKNDLKHHAENHCEKIGTGRLANLEFEKDKERYAEIMASAVEEIILKKKTEQEQLNENLVKGKLDQKQLQKLLDKGLFEIERIENYKRQGIISQAQADKIKEMCHGQQKLTERQLRRILEASPRILTIDEIKTIIKQGRPTPQEVRNKFETVWIDCVQRVPPVHDSTIDVEAAVGNKLNSYVGLEEGQLIRQLREGRQRSLKEWGDSIDVAFDVIEGVHYSNTTWKEWIASKMPYRSKRDDPFKEDIQSITKEVLKIAKKHLDEKASEKTDFEEVYILDLLRKLHEEIKKRAAQFSGKIALLPQYRIVVFLIACGYAVKKFEVMADSFREQNNPRIHLEKRLKEPLFTKFKNQYYQTAKEEAFASTLCAHLEEPIQTQVKHAFGTLVVTGIKDTALGHCFANKSALKARILIDLGDEIMHGHNPRMQERSFKNFTVYLSNTRQSLKFWITKYILEYCDSTSTIGKFGQTQLQILAQEEVKRLIILFENKMESIEEATSSKWLAKLCKDKDLISELGVNLKRRTLEVDGMHELNLKNVKGQVRGSLQELKTKLLLQFSDIKCSKEMIETWETNPVDILLKLAGCTEQCPFCGELCDISEHDQSIKHRASQHRPQCLGGYRRIESQEMALELCPSNVAGEREFENKDTQHKLHPYNKYYQIYPNWSIPHDLMAKDSSYWKWFVGHFYEELASYHNAKVPPIPEGWKEMKWNTVKKELQELYKFF